ncbi:MAG: glutaredoxin family protein [Theionarchaea archaeon]|nr:glutaredoxin family protein [Theionarchaea archaeon]MBU7001404.1 glutaredoxin family protein [Theionarchaea archaeon]MBU7021765.1 glutaredoxin family protein [Theionarchaea archaeon]MBU7034493.1 glutaredoxin family protein [Theionarchaea archaeon]MBU7040810.1 glutaredoxin family protein [Theionarchaea archaeon]
MKKLIIFIILTGLLLAPVTAEKIEIVMFHTPGCDFCAQVEEWLDELKAEYGDDITIRTVDVTSREGWNEFKGYGFSLTPAVAVNGVKLESEEITKESLIAAIEEGGQEQESEKSISFLTLMFGILSGTTACVLAVAAFMFAMVTSRQSKFTSILLTAISFGLGLIVVFMVMAVILGIGSYSLTGGAASTVRFYVSLALAYVVLVLGLNQFNYAFEVVKLPISTKKFFERILEGTLGRMGYLGAFLFGILFAPVKLPCAIPALGLVMERILLKGDLVEGLALAAIYGVGVLIPLIVVAIISGGSAQYASKLRWSETYRKVSWGIGGTIVLIVAAWIFWNTFKIPPEVTSEHYIALAGFGVATAVITVLFIRYGAIVTKSKTWKRASRALHKKFR